MSNSTFATRTSHRKPLRSAALAVAALTASSVFAQTDLAPVSVVGNGVTYTDAPAMATVNVVNFGDALVGNYTLEILLSTDATIDVADLVVASISTAQLGAVNVPVTLPGSAPTGLVHWGARISDAAGELALANNATIGTQVFVQTLDLELDDASPIHFFVRPTDVTTLIAEVNVFNQGSDDSVLVFSIEKDGIAPWLEITPPSSFCVGGDGPQPVQLTANYEGLLPGLYSTTVRFQNFSHASDFIEVPVTLEVGDPKFIPGDRLLGQVATIGDKDDMKFDAVKGMKLQIKFGVKAGTLNPRVEVVDPDGNVEKVLVFSNTKKLKKVAKLKKSGEYTLRVVADDGSSTGGWFARTNRKLPKQGHARVVTVKDPGTGIARVEVRLLPGATLDFAVKQGKKFAGPAILALAAPFGGSYDIAANIQPTSGVETRVEDVETQEVGSYWIEVAGFGANAKASAKVKILPVQPKRGKAKIYMP